MRVENPGIFRASQILKSSRRVDAHRRDRSLHPVLVVLQVIHGAVALTHSQHANRPLRPRQPPALDQTVQRLGRSDDRRDAGRIVVRALLEQVSERQDLFRVRSIRPADHAGHVRIDPRVVAAVDIRAHLHRTLLQEFPHTLRAARRNREAHERRAALGETPAVVPEGIDPTALIDEIAVLRRFTDHAECAGFRERALRGALAEDKLALHVLEVTRSEHHVRDHSPNRRRAAPHADRRGDFLIVGEHAAVGGHLRLDDFERAGFHVPGQRHRPEAALSDAVGRRSADLAFPAPRAPHDGRDVLRRFLELREREPAVRFPDGDDVAHRLVGMGFVTQDSEQRGRRSRRGGGSAAATTGGARPGRLRPGDGPNHEQQQRQPSHIDQLTPQGWRSVQDETVRLKADTTIVCGVRLQPDL